MPFLKTLIAVGVLTALGYIGNVASLPVAFSVSFLFGSIFVLIAVSLFGSFLGGISALIASSYTYILWNHPYAIVIFICEALWVSFSLKRKYTNIVLIDAAYWLLIGLPLVFIFYFGVMSLGFQNAAIIFLKQAINGIINALIAGILISHFPWQNWFRLPGGTQKVPYSQIIFQLTSAFLMIPLVGMLLFTNYQALKTIQTVAGELLVSESREANSLIRVWLERHIVAVETIAKLGKEQNFQPAIKVQAALEQINSLFPDFHNVFIADDRATTIAFFPTINEKGEKTIGINFSDREWFKQLKSTLKPVISDVFQGRGGVFAPIFSISVPVVEEGKLSGFGLGAVNLDKMRNLLVQSTHRNSLVFTVIDQNNNIVCSTNTENHSLTPWKKNIEGQTLIVGNGFSLWTPSSRKNISVMDVWKDAIYFVTLPIAGTKWTLLTEMPVAPLQGHLYSATIVNLVLIFCLFVIAIILSQIVSKLLVRTPVRLAALSRDIPQKLEKSAELTWPGSNIAEMHLLVENFKETTQALTLQYQNIKDANIHLEERVRERTAELREGELKYRSLIDCSSDAIFCVDEKGEYKFTNHVFASILGKTPDYFIGKTFWDVYPKEQADYQYEATKKVFQTGKSETFEAKVPLPNRTLFFLATANPIKDETGKVVLALTFGTDITDRKKIEDALRESEDNLAKSYESLTSILDSLDSLLYVVDFNSYEILFINKYGRDIWGDIQRGKCWQTIQKNKNGPCSFCTNDKLLSDAGIPTGVYQWEFQNTVTGRWYECRDQAISWIGKGLVRMEIATDITDRKNAEAEKVVLEAENRQLQKAESLGRMAGAIAHTFNNQLGVVIGNLDMAIDEQSPGAESARHLLTAAMGAANKAAEVSGQMLTYLGQSFDKRELIDLAGVCQKNLPILEASVPGTVALETDLSSPGPVVMGNAIEIQQALTNLITNAWEAVGTGRGSIHLGVKTVYAADISASYRFPVGWQPQDSAYACLEVTDTGGGIDDKDIEKLFDPFFTSKFTGRGLGLPMLLGIVKAHGGCVTVESVIGRGSTFRVFLPLNVEEISRQPAKDATPLAIEKGGTVLVVDDETMVRNMAATMLNRIGFSVLEAKDGVEAVEVFRQHQDKIRLVLSDLTMPRMNGWETLTALRKLAPDIPVILASGYDEAHVMAGDHPELPQVFLGKPYRLKGLSDAISQALVDGK